MKCRVCEIELYKCDIVEEEECCGVIEETYRCPKCSNSSFRVINTLMGQR